MSDFRTWDQLTVVEQLQCEFSDSFKDVHGFRPRFANDEQWNSEEWLRAQLVELSVAFESVSAAEKAEEAAAVVAFEQRVQEAIELGAADRETAIRWLFDAEDDQYVTVDHDYYCYKHGLPYGYFPESA